MCEWEDAERDLLEALGKDAKEPDTLANLVTVRITDLQERLYTDSSRTGQHQVVALLDMGRVGFELH